VTYSGGRNKGLTVVYRGRDGMVIWDAGTRTVATIDPRTIFRATMAPVRSLEISAREAGSALHGRSDPRLFSGPSGPLLAGTSSRAPSRVEFVIEMLS
jgi:hypothetical protein